MHRKLSETEKLALENEKMSDRLQSLRERLEMEKRRIDEKKRVNEGSIWNAGKTGLLHRHAEKVLNKHRESLASLKTGRFKGITEQGTKVNLEQ